MTKVKKVAILGSTGSIGINALKVIDAFPQEFKVVGLSSCSNLKLLHRQIKRYRPSYVTVVDTQKANLLRKMISGPRPRVFDKTDGLEEIARSKEADIVLIAIAGAAAIYPLLAAIEAKKYICLANKESIVIAGGIIMGLARKRGACIIPVDSEHNAIFQCIASSRDAVNRIYLTGSGGPLFTRPKSKFSSLTVREVLRHPKWKMGKKITVDSATLMNKGLEMIEAQHLFNVPIEKIELLIHPEAIVHSMVEFIDGSVIAQLGITDMRLPIQYALTYPERFDAIIPRLDFHKNRNLSFHNPDMGRFPCLELAIIAAKLGGTYPAVLSACDEEVVRAFLEGRISFVKIERIIEKILMKHRPVSRPRLSDIFAADRWAREESNRLC